MELMTVEEVAEMLKTTKGSLYTLLCNRGKNGGKQGSRIPQDIYVKFGRKTLFIKSKLVDWIENGAVLV